MTPDTRSRITHDIAITSRDAIAEATGIALSQIDAADRAGDDIDVTITAKATITRTGSEWDVTADAKSARSVSCKIAEPYSARFNPNEPMLPGVAGDEADDE